MLYKTVAAAETYNEAVDYDVERDALGPAVAAVRNIEWQLLRLSDVPPRLSEDFSFGQRLINAEALERGHSARPETLAKGRVDGVTPESQVAVLAKLGAATVAAVKAAAIPGGELNLGPVKVRASLGADGFFMALRVNYEWRQPA